MTDRLIRITTPLTVVTVAVAVVAAIISYQHAYELVRSHGESGVTARPMPFTVDGLIRAASMVVLDASRRNEPVPRLAAWSLTRVNHLPRNGGRWPQCLTSTLAGRVEPGPQEPVDPGRDQAADRGTAGRSDVAVIAPSSYVQGTSGGRPRDPLPILAAAAIGHIPRMVSCRARVRPRAPP